MFDLFNKIKKKAFEQGYKAGYALGKKDGTLEVIGESIDAYNRGYYDGCRAKMPKVLDTCLGKTKGSRGRRKNVRAK